MLSQQSQTPRPHPISLRGSQRHRTCGRPANVVYPSVRVTAISFTAVALRDRNLVHASAPCLLAVSSDVAVPPVIPRHNPASKPAESRTNRYGSTLKDPIRHQGCGPLIHRFRIRAPGALPLPWPLTCGYAPHHGHKTLYARCGPWLGGRAPGRLPVRCGYSALALTWSFLLGRCRARHAPRARPGRHQQSDRELGRPTSPEPDARTGRPRR
jgi:hypothetical protein